MRDERASELYERARQADEQSLSALLEEYLPRLHGFVRANMGPEVRQREDVADLVQSVCRELVQVRERLRFEDEARFRAWLFQVARNKIREKVRYMHRRRRDIDREAQDSPSAREEQLLALAYASAWSPSRQAAAREQVARFEAALDGLTEEHREVILLARVAGLPHEVIAEHMGRSVGAVRQLLGRALMKLSELL